MLSELSLIRLFNGPAAQHITITSQASSSSYTCPELTFSISTLHCPDVTLVTPIRLHYTNIALRPSSRCPELISASSIPITIFSAHHQINVYLVGIVAILTLTLVHPIRLRYTNHLNFIHSRLILHWHQLNFTPFLFLTLTSTAYRISTLTLPTTSPYLIATLCCT